MPASLFIVFTMVVGLLFFSTGAFAIDPPHRGPMLPQSCQSCHVTHNAAGAGMTAVAGNANLCISCHTSGGTASRKPFDPIMQALPGVSGTSHRWDSALPLASNPANTFGLRPASTLTTTVLRSYLVDYGNFSTCSVCHNPHSDASAAWDLFAGPHTGLGGGDNGIAGAGSTNLVIDDATKASYWTANAWQDYYVRIVSAASPTNIGLVRVIVNSTPTSLTVSSVFPAFVQAGDKYEIIGRHFQRSDNDRNQLCEDCHYYRVQNHVRVGGNDPTYPANGVNVFSHPVGEALHASGKGYDRSAPLDVNGMPQNGTRLGAGGESPDNSTNNLLMDNGNAVRCLTCHNVHHSDSNGLSVKVP